MAILWVNQGSATNNSDGFNTWFPDTYATARAIARRAVDDWNAVIQSFNYAEDSDGNPANNLHDTFNLTISALDLGNSNRGQVQFSTFSYNVDNAPTAATVELDNNAAGTGWFFDATPSDDAEFTGIAGIFQGSFVDASAAG